MLKVARSIEKSMPTPAGDEVAAPFMKDNGEHLLSRLAIATLLTITFFAFAIRICAGLFLIYVIHPDEIFQYLEQGNRLANGNGLVPWEYAMGTRSWLFPGLIGGVMAAARTIAPGPEAANISVMIAMSTLSLAPVVCGFLWGMRVGGTRAAVSAGIVNACWFELIYFAGHTLSESIAADSLVVGLYLAYPGVVTRSRPRLVTAGVFLGVAAMLRIQLAPAIAVGICAICGAEFRARYVPILTGGAIAIALSGALDAVTLGWPFQSLILNISVNVLHGAAAQFGQHPLHQYLAWQMTYGSGAFALFTVIALIGGYRLPPLLWVALTIFATHSVLAHKEYRFIYPAIPLMTTLVGIASALIADRLARDQRNLNIAFGLFAAAPIFWIVTSVILARSREFYPLWFQNRGSIEAMRVINADVSACGVAIYPAVHWTSSGGYAHLRSGIPLLGLNDGDPDRFAQGFNYIIGYENADFTRVGFRLIATWHDKPGRSTSSQLAGVYLWGRPGICDPAAAPALTTTLPKFMSETQF